jgi:RES domain-containing protein
VHIWRLTRRAFKEMDGEGARKAGGRWNSEGIPVLYASSTLALAALEYLVHVDADDVPDDLIAMQIEVPDEAPLEEMAAADLPRGWNRKPQHPACVEVGDRWIADGRALALRVPSAIVPEELNCLLNPAHPDAARLQVIRVREFAFDPRLL